MNMVESIKATYTRAPGSSVDILFKEPQQLAEARDKIEALSLSFRTDLPNKYAFIVIRKSREELRPNRLVHRACDFLEDAMRDHNHDELKTVTKDIRGKLVSNEGHGRVGGSIAGRWQWLPHFVRSNFLPQDVLSFGKDWIEDE